MSTRRCALPLERKFLKFKTLKEDLNKWERDKTVSDRIWIRFNTVNCSVDSVQFPSRSQQLVLIFVEPDILGSKIYVERQKVSNSQDTSEVQLGKGTCPCKFQGLL